MKYNYNNKSINIPDDYIQKMMDVFNINEEAAAKMYLEDEHYIINDEVTELTTRAKENGVGAKAPVAGRGGKRERKENPDKRAIISWLSDMIYEGDGMGESDWEHPFENVITANPEREITFIYKGNEYSITLIQHRKPKE